MIIRHLVPLSLSAVLIGLPTSVNADHCGVVQQQIVHHHQAAIVAHAPVAQLVTPVVQTTLVQAVVPLYSAVYDPRYDLGQVNTQQQTQQTNTADNEILLKILEEIKAMRGELNQLKPTQPSPPVLVAPEPIKEDARLKSIKTACYQCHNPDKADDAGGSFVMFEKDGSLLSFDSKDTSRIVSRVSRNSMPPPEKKLNPSAKSQILSFFKKEK